MPIEPDYTSNEQINDYIENRLENKDSRHPGWKETQNNKKFDIRKNPQSEQIKTQQALVRIDNPIINMTKGTGSPISFLNWATAKLIL